METRLTNDSYPDTELPAFQGDNDKQELVEEEDAGNTVKFEQCGGCSFYIEPLLFVTALTYFPLFILFPQYILSREMKRLTGNDSIEFNRNSCRSELEQNLTIRAFDPIKGNYTLAQASASYFSLQSTLVKTIPAMCFVMFIGPYSDKRGRKIAIIIPFFGGAINTLIIFLTAYFEWPIQVLLVGRFLEGCTGSFPAKFMSCSSFVADVTPKNRRHFRMVLIEIVGMAPSVISSASSGFLLNVFGFTMVFLIIFILSVLTLLYTIFVVPETVKKDPDAKIISIAYFKNAITVFIIDDHTKRRWKLHLLLAALFFCLFVQKGGNITTLFVMNFPLCWGSNLVGLLESVSVAISVVGSGIAIKVFNHFLRDAWIAVVGAIMDVGRCAFTFFVTTTAMMFGSAAFKATHILFLPTIRTMFSKIVHPNEVGTVFGVVAFFEGICVLLGTAVFDPLYAATQAVGMPSMVYLVMAGIQATGVVLMIIYAVLTRSDKKKDRDRQNNLVPIP